MTTSQLRKLNVIIQKALMSKDQTRLLFTLHINPNTTLENLANTYYGVKQNEKVSLRMSYLKKYLKEIILKLEYWGLPHVITVSKDGSVKLTMKAEELNGATK